MLHGKFVPCFNPINSHRMPGTATYAGVISVAAFIEGFFQQVY
jgi:hypothetical protein